MLHLFRKYADILIRFQIIYILETFSLTIDAESPQWVGAWWLGYLFAAAFMFLLVIPLSCLPQELKGK